MNSDIRNSATMCLMLAMIVASSPIAALPQAPPALEQQYLSWDFDSDSVGDCEVQKAHLEVHSDGHGYFDAVTRTKFTHSGDYWHQEVAFKGGGGNVVFRHTFTSPRMDEHMPWLHWHVLFSFSPTLYNSLSGSVDSFISC
jgi:hypothetical protein